MENPGPVDPDTAPASIGTWVCRGTYFVYSSSLPWCRSMAAGDAKSKRFPRKVVGYTLQFSGTPE